jgi:hypothetical protein
MLSTSPTPCRLGIRMQSSPNLRMTISSLLLYTLSSKSINGYPGYLWDGDEDSLTDRSLMVKVVPFPRTLSTSMVPLWLLMMS